MYTCFRISRFLIWSQFSLFDAGDAVTVNWNVRVFEVAEHRTAEGAWQPSPRQQCRRAVSTTCGAPLVGVAGRDYIWLVAGPPEAPELDPASGGEIETDQVPANMTGHIFTVLLPHLEFSFGLGWEETAEPLGFWFVSYAEHAAVEACSVGWVCCKPRSKKAIFFRKNLA